MHVIHKIQCFEEFLLYFALFFKNLIFLDFRLIELVFRPIKIAIKNVCESLSISIGARLVLDQLKHFQPIKSVFQSTENRVENFLKNSQVSCAQTYFFKRGWSDHNHTQLCVQSLANSNLYCVCN